MTNWNFHCTSLGRCHRLLKIYKCKSLHISVEPSKIILKYKPRQDPLLCSKSGQPWIIKICIIRKVSIIIIREYLRSYSLENLKKSGAPYLSLWTFSAIFIYMLNLSKKEIGPPWDKTTKVCQDCRLFTQFFRVSIRAKVWIVSK
jgi:hypothetical protein